MDDGLDDTNFDTLYGLLSDSHRRYILYYFLDSNHANVDDLSRQIAGWERDVPVETISEKAAEKVTLSLVHNHILRLVDHGVVNYDRRNGDIVVDEQFDSIRSTVERARTIEAPGIADCNSTTSFHYSDPLTERDDQ